MVEIGILSAAEVEVEQEETAKRCHLCSRHSGVELPQRRMSVVEVAAEQKAAEEKHSLDSWHLEAELLGVLPLPPAEVLSTKWAVNL